MEDNLGEAFLHLTMSIQAMSARIDAEPINQQNTPLENLLLRGPVKIGEELGELNEAIIGMTGQNPRKGFTHTQYDVDKELLDIALTALGTYEHRHGNNGSALAALAIHVAGVRDRQTRYDEEKAAS